MRANFFLLKLHHLISYLLGFGNCEGKKIGRRRLEQVPEAFCRPVQYSSDQTNDPSSVFTRQRPEFCQGSFIPLQQNKPPTIPWRISPFQKGIDLSSFELSKNLRGTEKKKGFQRIPVRNTEGEIPG